MGLKEHIEQTENEVDYSWALYFEEMRGICDELQWGDISADAALCQLREVHQHAKDYGLPVPEFFITLKTLKKFNPTVE